MERRLFFLAVFDIIACMYIIIIVRGTTTLDYNEVCIHESTYPTCCKYGNNKVFFTTM